MQIPFHVLLRIGLKSCLVCGSFQVLQDELCERCREKILSKVQIQGDCVRTKDFQIPFLSLISWVPAESDHLSRFFLNLKGEVRKQTWNWLAQVLQREMVLNSLSKKIFLQKGSLKVIPCPSKSGKQDHAAQWALALTQELGGEYFPCLEWSKKPLFKQRRQNRQERWSFTSGKHVKFTRNHRVFGDLNDSAHQDSLFLFADDVITTGSTSAQAYLALGQPKNFMVLTVGHRAFLAKSQSIC